MKIESILKSFFPLAGPGAAIVASIAPHDLIEASRGWASITEAIAIDTDTPFELASASKLITATAILKEVENGNLTLNTPIHDLLSSAKPPVEARAITLRDLLQHTSGLPEYLSEGAATPTAHLTWTYIEQQLPRWSAQARPGLAHSYSNTNYVVLAAILERLHNRAFASYLESEVLRPFGITKGRVDPRGISSEGIAQGYHAAPMGSSVFEASLGPTIDTVGDGGLVCGAKELAKWLRHLWAGEIISHRSLSLMQANGTTDEGQAFAYGLGIQLQFEAGNLVWCGHGGGWTSSTTLVSCYPPDDIVIVVLSNEVMAPVEQITQAIWQELR